MNSNMGKIGYFFVLLTLTICQAETKGNIRNLFDSIIKNDSRKTETQRIILGEEIVREQQAFDSTKYDIRQAREENAHRLRTLWTIGDHYEKAAKIKRASDANQLDKQRGETHETEIPESGDVWENIFQSLKIPINTRLDRLTKSQLQMVLSKLHEKYKDAMKYKIILTLRSIIEDTVRDLFPKGLSLPSSYKERVVIILKSGNPEARPLLDDVITTFCPENPEKAIELFSESVDHLFGKSSGEGAHAVVDPAILKHLRTCNDTELEIYLALLKVQPFEKYIKAVRVLSKIQPMSHDGYKGTLDSHCCVQMLPCNQQKKWNRNKYNVIKEDVLEFYPTSIPVSVNFHPNDPQADTLSIEVRFENTNTAIRAYNENRGWLKRVKVALKIVSCATENPPAHK